MSHTPGPWSWWTSNSYRRLTADGKQDGGVLSAVSTSGHADVRVSDSDAHLIAAAPDLLQALCYMRQVMASSWVSQSERMQAISDADKAIRKAIGEAA